MAALGNAAPIATGDPTFCTGCHACLSAVSIIYPTRGITAPASAGIPGQVGLGQAQQLDGSPKDGCQGKSVAAEEKFNATAAHEGIDDTYNWTCEFCRVVNIVELDEMEKPLQCQESVDYVLEPPPVSAAVATGSAGKSTTGAKVKPAWPGFCVSWS